MNVDVAAAAYIYIHYALAAKNENKSDGGKPNYLEIERNMVRTICLWT